MVPSQQRNQRSSQLRATSPTQATGGSGVGVSVGAARVAAALAGPGAPRSRDEWLAVVAHCQSLINTVTAVQDAAIAEAARHESVWCEDGTLGESVHAPGHITLDAADVVAPVIGATHQQAGRRVEQAVRLAAARVPVPAGDRDAPQGSGLGGLHQAMAAGQLDGYRAGVVAFELEVAPAHVADAVVAALSGHFGDDSTVLRRRTRVLLSRISPDLVRERAKRARNQTGLRRWVAEPGVDEWHGTFPSEDAATAWAAIDRLAHDLVTDGTCTTIEQARGKALTDLVTGNATIDVQIVLTVPADTRPGCEPGDANAAVGGVRGSEPQLAAAARDVEPATGSGQPASTTLDGHSADVQANDPGPGREPVSSSRSSASTEADRSFADAPAGTAAVDETAAGLPRSVADESCGGDTDARPTAAVRIDAGVDGAPAQTGGDTYGVPAHAPPMATADDDDLVQVGHAPRVTTGDGDDLLEVGPAPWVTTGDDDLVEVQGSRPSEPLLVRRAWLRDQLHKSPPQPHPSRPRRRRPKGATTLVPCDPLTGARLDPAGHLSTDAYRPSAELIALVKARDGRCRFPGCSVAARFCDLDHVRPWPIGPTAAPNLLTLCRRHHRIKQRPGWRLRLEPDATATWTDPTGRTRTTAPLDALHTLVLTADPADPADTGPAATPSDAGPRATAPDPGPAATPCDAGHPATPPDAALAATAADPGRAVTSSGAGHQGPAGEHERVPLPAANATRSGLPAGDPVPGAAWSALETHLTFRLEHHVNPMDHALRAHPTHRRCTSAAELRAGHARARSRARWPDDPPF